MTWRRRSSAACASRRSGSSRSAAANPASTGRRRIEMALLSVEEALARVLDGVEPLPAEDVPIAAACGRVLAADLAALRSQPPAAVSAMDGYAVRAADVMRGTAELKLI